jgi:hypothetical protein
MQLSQIALKTRFVLSFDVDAMPIRIGADLLLVALLEVCVAAVGTVYADGVLERFTGEGYLCATLAVVAAASVICVGISISALWRARHDSTASSRLVCLALVTHGMLAMPGLVLIGLCLWE